jgi:hypothetical protein
LGVLILYDELREIFMITLLLKVNLRLKKFIFFFISWHFEAAKIGIVKSWLFKGIVEVLMSILRVGVTKEHTIEVGIDGE